MAEVLVAEATTMTLDEEEQERLCEERAVNAELELADLKELVKMQDSVRELLYAAILRKDVDELYQVTVDARDCLLPEEVALAEAELDAVMSEELIREQREKAREAIQAAMDKTADDLERAIEEAKEADIPAEEIRSAQAQVVKMREEEAKRRLEEAAAEEIDAAIRTDDVKLVKRLLSAQDSHLSNAKRLEATKQLAVLEARFEIRQAISAAIKEENDYGLRSVLSGAKRSGKLPIEEIARAEEKLLEMEAKKKERQQERNNDGQEAVARDDMREKLARLKAQREERARAQGLAPAESDAQAARKEELKAKMAAIKAKKAAEAAAALGRE